MALAGAERREMGYIRGSASTITAWRMEGSDDKEKTSMFEKSLGGVCENTLSCRPLYYTYTAIALT